MTGPLAVGRSRFVVAMLSAYILLSFTDKAILGLVGPRMTDDLGLTNSEFGAIGSSFSLLFTVSGVLFGLLGNRLSARWLLAGLAVVWSVAQLPVLLPVVGFGALIATRVLLGAGEGPALPLATHTAFTWVPERGRAMAASVVAIGGSVGILVMAPPLVLAIAVWGWRAPFGILGLLGLVWAALWIAVGGAGPYGVAPVGVAGKNGKPPDVESLNDVAGKNDQPLDVGGPDNGGAHQRTLHTAHAVYPERLPYRRILTTGTWWGSVLAWTAVNWMLGLGLTWLPTYLEEQAGYAASTVSLLVGLPSIGSIVAILGAGTVAARLRARGRSARLAYGVVPAVALALAGVATLGVTRLGHGVVLLVLLTVGFSAGTALTPLVSAAMAEISPVSQRAGVLAAAYAVSSLGSVAAPAVTGRIIDLATTDHAGFTAAFELSAVLLLAAAAIAATTIRPDRHAAALTER